MTNTLSLEEKIETLKERLANNPGILLEPLVEKYDVSFKQAIEALPTEMWSKVEGDQFVNLLEKISTIGSVVVITNTADAILEFKGPFPKGELSHGFYNLQGDKVGLHGHLRPNRCEAIYFIERPFMKKTTASIIFINLEGGVIFKIFLGRDESGAISVEQLDAFHTMAQLSEDSQT